MAWVFTMTTFPVCWAGGPIPCWNVTNISTLFNHSHSTIIAWCCYSFKIWNCKFNLSHTTFLIFPIHPLLQPQNPNCSLFSTSNPFYMDSRVMDLKKICVFNGFPQPQFYSLLELTVPFASGSQAWLKHLGSLRARCAAPPALTAGNPLTLRATPRRRVGLGSLTFLGILFSGSFRVWLICDSDDCLSFSFFSGQVT